MHGADYVLVDGVMFETETCACRTRTSSRTTSSSRRERVQRIAFTREEFDGAEDIGEGVYRLQSGALIRFLSTATVH